MKSQTSIEKHKQKYCSRIKHLIVYCHPNADSLSAAYKDELTTLTRNAGHEVLVRDLYNIAFHPVLSVNDFTSLRNGEIPCDIKLEQDYIRGADLITFIYPIWWTGMPAMLKGYIDRVFAKGFAYDEDPNGEIKGLLTGKKVIILNNIGEPLEHYKKTGMLDALRQTCDVGIFEFCAMEVLAHHFFGHITASSREERAGHLKTLEYLYNKYIPCRL